MSEATKEWHGKKKGKLKGRKRKLNWWETENWKNNRLCVLFLSTTFHPLGESDSGPMFQIPTLQQKMAQVAHSSPRWKKRPTQPCQDRWVRSPADTEWPKEVFVCFFFPLQAWEPPPLLKGTRKLNSTGKGDLVIGSLSPGRFSVSKVWDSFLPLRIEWHQWGGSCPGSTLYFQGLFLKAPAYWTFPCGSTKRDHCEPQQHQRNQADQNKTVKAAKIKLSL